MCENSIALTVLLYAKVVINVLQIVVPLALVITLSISLLKEVASQDVKLNECLKKSVDKLIAAAIFFLLPYVVSFSFALIGEANVSFDSCYNSVSKDMIAHYEQIEQQEYEEKMGKDGYYKNIETVKNEVKYEIKKNASSKSSVSSQTGESTKEKMEKNGVVLDLGNITVKSNVTPQQLTSSFTNYGGNAKNMIKFSNGYVEAENKYSVNAFALASIEALESGWATSEISKSCNNLGGVCYASQKNATPCLKNSNCTFAKFSSPEYFVDYHASMLSNSYLKPNGSYYEGTALSDVQKHYCPTPDCTNWSSTIGSIAKGLFNGI